MSVLAVKLSIEEIARFFSKVEVDRVTGCWNWTGRVSDGYGNVRHQGRLERSHRIAFAWIYGPIPRVENRTSKRAHVPQLDHVVCQNRRCCNPAHLELVTAQVNFLRGNAPNARKASATHCEQGHEFAVNGRVEKVGKGYTARRCWPCRREQMHQAYLERKKRKQLCG